MNMPVDLDDVSKYLVNFATEKLPGWSKLFYDIRIAPEGVDSGVISRFVCLRGEERKGFSIGGLQDILLEKRFSTGEEWFGLLLIIDSQGNINPKFNYDINAMVGFTQDERNKQPF